MIYVFEGVDGVGKTTLVNDIYKYRFPDYEMIKLVKPYSQEEILNFYQFKLFNYIIYDKNVILDRCYLISHPIYSNVLNDNLKFMTEDECKYLLNPIRNEIRIIYCKPDNINKIKHNIEEDDIRKKIEELNDKYDEYMEKLENDGFDVIWINPMKIDRDRMKYLWGYYNNDINLLNLLEWSGEE